MFTDMEGSTNLLSTRGFTESHEIIEGLRMKIIDEKVAEHAGRRIKGLGDGLMVSFGSSRHGVECALEIQKAIAEYSKQNPERKIRIRIGINTGEVVEEAGDIFGAAVNVAARVAGKAKGGEILVSDVVRSLVGPIAEIKLNYKSHFQLKGFPDRWRIHKVTPGEVDDHGATVVPTGDGFVGREQEQLDMRMVLDRAATGSGGIVFVAGAPGIGASRFAAEVAGDAVRKGWVVLGGAAPESAAGPLCPFPGRAQRRRRIRRSAEDPPGCGGRERTGARAGLVPCLAAEGPRDGRQSRGQRRQAARAALQGDLRLPNVVYQGAKGRC